MITVGNNLANQLFLWRNADVINDPYVIYRLLRDKAPVTQTSHGLWVISRYADVKELLQHPQTIRAVQHRHSRNTKLPLTANEIMRQYWLSIMDGEAHKQLKKLTYQALYQFIDDSLIEDITAISHNLIKPLTQQTHFDIMTAYATPLPFQVMMKILGIPQTDWAELANLLHHFEGSLEPFPSLSKRRQLDQATEACLKYFKHALNHTAHTTQYDKLKKYFDTIASASDFKQEHIIYSTVFLLLAGHETLSHLIGNGLAALLNQPQHLKFLATQQTIPRTAIDELLRYDSSIQMITQVANQAIQLNEQQIAKGDSIALLIGSANHDERVFAHPATLDLKRHPNKHLAFGYAAHRCIGNQLTYLEASVAFKHLLTLMPLTIVKEKTTLAPQIFVRGFNKLTVTRRC